MSNNDLLPQQGITLFVGEFGSGKTEMAVNYALYLEKRGYSTAIVDIDLVKPYFRTRENQELLESHGIHVVAPEKRLSNADLPILPQNLFSILADENKQVIIDVGGSESSVALGQISSHLASRGYEALLVVNTCRPFTNSVDGIVSMCSRIEQLARIRITGLVSNSNLAGETTSRHIDAGLAIAESAAQKLNLPLRWVVVPHWLAREEGPYPVFELKPYTQYPWME